MSLPGWWLAAVASKRQSSMVEPLLSGRLKWAPRRSGPPRSRRSILTLALSWSRPVLEIPPPKHGKWASSAPSLPG
eukprot:13462269-Alexandrium_andersonii.AAC.1